MAKRGQTTGDTAPKKRKRGQGEGSIFYIESKKLWCAKMTIGYDDNGKQKQKAFYGKTSREVQEKLTAAKVERDKGLYIEPSKITVSNWMDIYMTEYKMRSIESTTYLNYENMIQVHIKPRIGGYKLKDVRSDMIQKIINDLDSKDLSQAYIFKIINVLSGAFEQAIKNDMLYINPTKNAVLPKKRKSKAKVFTVEEQKRFINECKNFAHGDVFIMSLGTGLRIGEVLALQWTDINFEEGTLSVSKTLQYTKNIPNKDEKRHVKLGPPKTPSSRRKVPLIPILLDLLKKARNKQTGYKLVYESAYEDNGFIFCTELGRALLYSSVCKTFKRILKEADIEKTSDLRLHCLRHTFATRGLENGIELKVMQELLGHSSIQMTADLYTHVLPDKKKDSIMKLKDTITL